MEKPLKHRDVDWLYFNERVLLEAANKDTPLLERLKFLAIFSSNLDEFFKVRVSQSRQLKAIDRDLQQKLAMSAGKQLTTILEKITRQQQLFGKVIEKTLAELRKNDIYIQNIEALSGEQRSYVHKVFDRNIRKDCQILDIPKPSALIDGQLYLVVWFGKEDLKLVKLPTTTHSRFIEIPGPGYQYLFLDDIVKINLDTIFQGKLIKGAYSIKLSRDAELYLEDDYTDTALVEKIYQSLGKRGSGQPTRLLYDKEMPNIVRLSFQKALELGEVDMILGGTYHNMSDFFTFPIPSDKTGLTYEPQPSLPHPILSQSADIFQSILTKDQLIHFPYQEFAVTERFIAAAADDPEVSCIKMSLYRIAKTSALTDALLRALDNEKHVVLFVEAQARFDEANNIQWGRLFKEKGATVLYSIPNIKVHSKIALVERQYENNLQRFGFIGTGNFNAKTAKLYCDHALFTAHEGITADLAQVFDVLERKLIIPKTKHLLVSPFNTRTGLLELIQNETDHALAGKKAKITLKMNSLEDSKMIFALYRASEAGVKVRLLVRGFSCLVPQKPEALGPEEEPIYVTSIVDRYLEHGRIYLFENGGKEIMYMGSADWMTRNLDKRIEVLTPILEPSLFQELKDILFLQLGDTYKARILDADSTNSRVVKAKGKPQIRSQYAIYEYLKDKVS
ncbi:MAG: polyphosphate kinase 1 [Bacteroidota bacterium]